jgi:hypothetical protein
VVLRATQAMAENGALVSQPRSLERLNLEAVLRNGCNFLNMICAWLVSDIHVKHIKLCPKEKYVDLGSLLGSFPVGGS